MTYSLDFTISDLKSIGFKASQNKIKEQELTGLTKVNVDMKHSFTAFMLIDLDRDFPYAIKVVMKTATSSLTHYSLFPTISRPKKDLKTFSFSTSPSCPRIGDEFEVSFNVTGHEATKSDWVGIFKEEGSYVTYAYNADQAKNGIFFFEIDKNQYIPNTKYVLKYMTQDKGGDKTIMASEPFTFE